MPIEVGGRGRGPGEDVAIAGGVLELVPADANSERLGRIGERHDLLDRLHGLKRQLAGGKEALAIEHFELVVQCPRRRDANY